MADSAGGEGNITGQRTDIGTFAAGNSEIRRALCHRIKFEAFDGNGPRIKRWQVRLAIGDSTARQIIGARAIYLDGRENWRTLVNPAGEMWQQGHDGIAPGPHITFMDDLALTVIRLRLCAKGKGEAISLAALHRE